MTLTLEQLWKTAGFKPNDNQRAAIQHVDGPLYLPAGPGSGKTRVLLWRTVNLIVFQGVSPEDIYLSTFTEKAAFQLREGLRALLALVTNQTGKPYDLAKMYVGTVHSLCQRLLLDRRFYPQRQRGQSPALLDELGQYFFVYKRGRWADLTTGWEDDDIPERMKTLFKGRSASRHAAVTSAISLFNRLSEECADPANIVLRADDETLRHLLEMYGRYLEQLAEDGPVARTDFSLLQQKGLQLLERLPQAGQVFKHVIIDEYQDTNTVQERLFFRMASGHKNICVVGDDDQALYRFRGATVENFVEFPARCQRYLRLKPRTIPLNVNYRSRRRIVDFYTGFMEYCDWRKPKPARGAFRVAEKDIQAASRDKDVSVIASRKLPPPQACAEVAGLVREILDQGKVENPNQIAFLYPSLKAASVKVMIEALENVGLKVYAPRAGRFIEVEESTAMFGVFLHIFGRPARGDYGGDYKAFHDWMDRAWDVGASRRKADKGLDRFIRHRQEDLERAKNDYLALLKVVEKKKWDLNATYEVEKMKRALYDAPGLSETGKRALSSRRFERAIALRLAEWAAGQRGPAPYTLGYVVARATSIEGNLLDLFYQVCGFDHFRRMFDLAESGEDEGPICNLGLISQYLARYLEEYPSVLTAEQLVDDRFQRLFFSSYLFALFRRGESEYEDAEDPFPKGRIPFLTIHQSKGLEFPVVVLGNPRKQGNEPQVVEKLVRPLLDREGEPLDRQAEFDRMRMFYVALSRAQNLLVITHLGGQGNFASEPFASLLDDDMTRIPDFDVDSLPAATLKNDDLPKNYSYTGDYLQYQRCPRYYMVFRKYGLVPSRTQTMVFGSLVHRTLDDLHQFLIANRSLA